MDRNLERVDNFYNKKYAEASRRLKALSARYGSDSSSLYGAYSEEITDLVGVLLELRAQLRKLQWFGEVNRRGFIKITKKLDKKVPTSSVQQRYLASRVDPRAFATNASLAQDVGHINVWLAELSELGSKSSTMSPPSSIALSRVSSRTNITASTQVLDAIDSAIEQDLPTGLAEALSELAGNTTSEPATVPNSSTQKLSLSLLQRAISCRSQNCIVMLLGRIISLTENDDLNRRNCIHRLTISIGRSMAVQDADPDTTNILWDPRNIITPAEAPNFEGVSCAPREGPTTLTVVPYNSSLQLLAHLLDAMSGTQQSSIVARDSFGRMPIHYAAQYGVLDLCKILMQHMVAWGYDRENCLLKDLDWQDLEGNEPIYFSVLGGHPLTTQLLLDSYKTTSTHEDSSTLPRLRKSGQLLALATSANFSNIVSLLAKACVDVNFQDEHGETALHLAARFGHLESAKALLETCSVGTVNLNMPENTFGWTPILLASVDGHLPIVEFLVAAGADLTQPDSSGWTAIEHATLRGHMNIAKMLSAHTPAKKAPSVTKSSLLDAPRKSSSLHERTSNSSSKDSNLAQISLPVKSFGHRYLTNESMILVSLGSMDHRKDVKPVQLDNIPVAKAHATQLDTALSIVVSVLGAIGEPAVIDLPVQENISTEPIVFTTKDITKVKVLFDIVPTYAGADEQVVGRGVALLSSVKPSIGSKRMNLQGDLSVPIVSAKTLDVLGSVNFNFLVVTPFTHPNMTITETDTYWKSLAAPMVIGHRGLGKNIASRKSLQLGENTMQSFIAAANLGASYVEFDVQLTKDHVPVIYHDFLVSETGIDAPVHALTLEQFLHVGDSQSPRPSRPPSPSRKENVNASSVSHENRRRHRATSLGAMDHHQSSDMAERMKHTRDFKIQGFKGNSRGNFIQAPFTTLEEMLRKLPASIGFNIEMKYPMLFESEEHEMDTYAVELNSFVDTVLKMVYDLAGKRNIIFSSFNPDICLLLSLKQPSIPILFLSDAGTSSVGDIRASSLQEAIRFASRWNLLGVVAAAEPLVLCPRLVRVIKESGLVCVSYGSLNNEPENVKVSPLRMPVKTMQLLIHIHHSFKSEKA